MKTLSKLKKIIGTEYKSSVQSHSISATTSYEDKLLNPGNLIQGQAIPAQCPPA